MVQTRKVTKQEQPVVKEEKTTKKASLKATVFDTTGKEKGTIELDEKIFGAKVNPVLMSQAVRVYLANQRQGTHSSKTRGEVQGSTRKIYRQKGTGRARHGGIRAPIFVHGGIAHGPKPRDYSLDLTKKMKKLALFSSLTSKLQDGDIKFIDGLEALEPKTKLMEQALTNLSLTNKKRKVLVVVPKKAEGDKTVEKISRAMHNLAGINVTSADRINTYEVLNNKVVVMTKNAAESLTTHFKGEK